MNPYQYMTFDPEQLDVEFFNSEEEAENHLNLIFENCEDGFSEDMQNGGYIIAKVIKRSKFKPTFKKESEQFGYIEMENID